ncbi:MAG: hypothetical protein U1E73_08935 [Planctomycetota bacterium]
MNSTPLLSAAALLLNLLPAQRTVAIGDAAVAVGPGYTATFAPAGMTFLQTGSGADPRPFHWRLSAVRRGSVDCWVRRGDCAPQIVGDTVRHAHAAGPVEIYEVRDDGVEQSFVFSERLVGRGDLVVSGTIRTDLPLLAVGDDGARFGSPGAAVSLGAVTGIDANGATVRGGMRVVGDTVELSLPAAFVDSATYPLVLDPLIGSSFLIANIAGGSDVQPGLAFDVTTQRYLVVWSVPMSATAAQIRAQFVSATGFVGQQMLLSSSATPGIRPAVANVNSQDLFAVSWVGGGYAQLASIDAATGAISTTVPWVTLLATTTGVALGGDVRTGAGTNRVLWTITSTGSVAGTQSTFVRLATVTGGTPVLGTQSTLSQNQADDYAAPAVSRHCGSNGTWLTAFAFRSTTVPTFAGVVVTPVSSLTTNPTVCQSQAWNWTVPLGAFPLHASVAIQADNAFLVAHQSTATTIAMRSVYTLSCGAPPTLGTLFDPTGTSGPDDHPEVDWADGRYVLAWRHTNSTTPHAMVMAFLGTASGSQALVEGATVATQHDPTVCTRWSGGDTGNDEALLSWANAGIKGRRWEKSGTGTVTNLGGACGTTGFNDYATYTGTPVIGSGFTMDLLSPTGPVVALVVGFSATPLGCGPCTLVPSPDLMLGALTSAHVTLPFDPGLIGLDLIAQWVQWRPGGCPLYPTLGVSNALKFTIAE